MNTILNSTNHLSLITINEPTSTFLVFTGVALAIFLFLFILMKINNSGAIHTLYKSKKSLISDVSEGEWVKIVGTASQINSNTLVAPITEKNCIAYDVLFKCEMEMSNNQFHRYCEKEATSFFISDDSGSALIKGPTFKLELTKTWKFKDLKHRNTGQSIVLRYFNKYGHRPHSPILKLKKKRILHEGVVEDNTKVAIYGFAQWETHANGEKQLIIRSKGGDPVLISNDISTLWR